MKLISFSTDLIKVTILLSVTLIAAANVCNNLTGGTGFVPHEFECNKYYSCKNYVSAEYTCVAGFIFNKCNNVCQLEKDIEAKCKCEICSSGSGVKIFPSSEPNQCRKYVMCVEGKQANLECPPGLSFSFDRTTVTGSCKNSTLVDCDVETCSKTWKAEDKQIQIAFAPSYKNCRNHHVCFEGKQSATLSCPEGFWFDVKTENIINGKKFNGTCTPWSEKLACFDESNWKAPY